MAQVSKNAQVDSFYESLRRRLSNMPYVTVVAQRQRDQPLADKVALVMNAELAEKWKRRRMVLAEIERRVRARAPGETKMTVFRLEPFEWNACQYCTPGTAKWQVEADRSLICDGCLNDVRAGRMNLAHRAPRIY